MQSIVQYDAVVIGLGGWGSAALYHLARRGHAVLGLDRFAPPHDRGAHHGRSRVIRRASHESAGQTGFVDRAYELWRELEDGLDEPLLREVGGFYAAPLRHELVAGALAGYREHGIPHEVLDRDEAAERFPWATVHDGEVVVHEPSAGVLHPERCVRAHLDGAAAAGAEIRLGEAVTRWTPRAGGVEVETERGTYTAARAILALGAWHPDFGQLDLPLSVERQVVAVYDVAAGHDLTTVAFASRTGEQFYGVPEGEGAFKVAMHHGGEIGTADSLPGDVTRDDLDILEAHVAERLAPLGPALADAYVCKYTNTPDRRFVMGRHPDHPAVVFATGESGRGFKFASAIGEALADLAEGSPARYV